MCRAADPHRPRENDGSPGPARGRGVGLAWSTPVGPEARQRQPAGAVRRTQLRRQCPCGRRVAPGRPALRVRAPHDVPGQAAQTLGGRRNHEGWCLRPSDRRRTAYRLDARLQSGQSKRTCSGQLDADQDARRFERGSLLLTNNVLFSQWAAAFADDQTLTTALPDRRQQHARIEAAPRAPSPEISTNYRGRAGRVIATTPASTHSRPSQALGGSCSPSSRTPRATPIGTRR